MDDQQQSGEAEAQKLLRELREQQDKVAKGRSSSGLNTMRAVSLVILVLICIGAIWLLSRGLEALPEALEKQQQQEKAPFGE